MNIQDVAKWHRAASIRVMVEGIYDTNPDEVKKTVFSQRLHTEMAESCERFTWRPIETAPKDKTILLHMKGGGIDIGFWNGRSWDDGDYYDDMGEMTHWMPLPETPV